MRRLSLVPLVLVLTLAACGGAEPGSGPSVSPRDAVHQAAAKRVAAKSALFAVEGTMRDKQYAERALPFKVKGQTAFGREKAWLWWDLRDVYPSLIASGTAPGEREIYRAFLDDPRGWRMEVRIRGRYAWVSLPAVTEIFHAKSWIKKRSSELLERDIDGESDFPSLDFGELIIYLKAANHVEEIGVEDGLTHYRARVPLRRLAAQAPKNKRARLRREARQVIAQTGKQAIPLQVWLDSDGVPHRFRVTEWEPRNENERYPTTYRTGIEILEYGVDFDVPRPPARKVMTAKEFDQLAGS